MIITKEAIRLLALMNSSCRTFQEKKEDNSRHLYDLANSNADLPFETFLRDFPQRSMTAAMLKMFVKKNKANVIDRQLVMEFFGGIDHINFAIEQLADWEFSVGQKGPKLSQMFKDKYLFAHVAVPVEIVRKHPAITGKYMVGGIKIHLRGLVAHPMSFSNPYLDLSVGNMYLTHYATIIEPVSNDDASWLRRQHLISREFLSAMSGIGTLDYRKFWSLTQWTEDMLKRCGF